MTWVVGSSGSRRWKLRWQPHAAHLREVGSAGVEAGDGMNSPQPSKACPPRLAAWFLRHSLYDTRTTGFGGATPGWRRLSPLEKDKVLAGGWVCGGVAMEVVAAAAAGISDSISTGLVAVAVTSMGKVKHPRLGINDGGGGGEHHDKIF